MTRDASVSEPNSRIVTYKGLTVEDVGVLLWLLPLRCIRWLLLSSSLSAHSAIRRIERSERFRLDAAERIQHLGVHAGQVGLKGDVQTRVWSS